MYNFVSHSFSLVHSWWHFREPKMNSQLHQLSFCSILSSKGNMHLNFQFEKITVQVFLSNKAMVCLLYSAQLVSITVFAAIYGNLLNLYYRL